MGSCLLLRPLASKGGGRHELWSGKSGSAEQRGGLRRSPGQQLPPRIRSAASDRRGSVVRTGCVLEIRGAEGAPEPGTARGAAFVPRHTASPCSTARILRGI